MIPIMVLHPKTPSKTSNIINKPTIAAIVQPNTHPIDMTAVTPKYKSAKNTTRLINPQTKRMLSAPYSELFLSKKKEQQISYPKSNIV